MILLRISKQVDLAVKELSKEEMQKVNGGALVIPVPVLPIRYIINLLRG